MCYVEFSLSTNIHVIHRKVDAAGDSHIKGIKPVSGNYHIFFIHDRFHKVTENHICTYNMKVEGSCVMEQG